VTDPPDLPVPGLERVDTGSETTRLPPFLTVRTETHRYEHPPTLARLGPLLGHTATGSPRSVFLAAVDVLPRLPGSRTPAIVLDFATRHTAREFGNALERDGLEAVEHLGTESRTADHAQVRLLEFRAAYPLAGEAVFGAPSRATLAVTVLVGLWPVPTGFSMAGGIYPSEDVTDVADRLGVTCRTTERLNPAPDRDRAWLLDLVDGLARDGSPPEPPEWGISG